MRASQIISQHLTPAEKFIRLATQSQSLGANNVSFSTVGYDIVNIDHYYDHVDETNMMNAISKIAKSTNVEVRYYYESMDDNRELPLMKQENDYLVLT